MILYLVLLVVIKNKYFLFLLVLFVFTRLIPISGGRFPFAYDNAKDSLVLMQAWVFYKPPLLGAVTSLEGLWQGPGWYYILFPLNLFFSFHPFASVLTVVALGIFTLCLFYKHLGKVEATLYTTSSAIITTQQTAWSPYLTSFSTAWILVLLKLLKKRPETKQLVFLALSTALLFHAEIAFGFVFAPIILYVLVKKGIKPSPKQLMLTILAFILTFVPQLIFELRHNFLQTKGVLYFLSNFSEQTAKIQGEAKNGILHYSEVFSQVAQNLFSSITPIYITTSQYFVIILTLVFFIALYKTANNKNLNKIILTILLTTTFLFFLLPFKSFYLVGLVPFWIYGFAQLIKLATDRQQKIILTLFVLLALLETVLSSRRYQKYSQTTNILFAQKIAAVEKAYELTNNSPFVSYHYLPEVYDYTYQHIYQYIAHSTSRSLPVEYSYSSGESEYMQTLKTMGSNEDPVYTVLIVEKDERPQFFPTWWNNQTRGKVLVNKTSINSVLTVYLFKDAEIQNQ